jgi:acetoin utilization deacetylase AcuC-like enzyme
MDKATTLIISDPVYQEHDTGEHPERALRAQVLHTMATRLADGDARFRLRGSVLAELSRIQAVHDGRYIEALREFCEEGGGQIDLNTVTSPRSYEVALRAAGGLMSGVDAVLSGEVRNAFAIVRPPGHHAVPGGGLGFCLFNNVAVAAQYLLDVHGLERVLVVDWDVHHGNGTQDAFYEDPRVLFFSTHQANIYPGTGSLHEIGRGQGSGYNANIALPGGSGDAVLDYAFEAVLQPLAERFQPQFVLVSAGYDGHWRDRLAGLNLSVAGYAQLTRRLTEIADTFCAGRIAFVLEGGYDVQALSASVRATLLTAAGTNPDVAAQTDSIGVAAHAHAPTEPTLRDLFKLARQIHKL